MVFLKAEVAGQHLFFTHFDVDEVGMVFPAMVAPAFTSDAGVSKDFSQTCLVAVDAFLTAVGVFRAEGILFSGKLCHRWTRRMEITFGALVGLQGVQISSNKFVKILRHGNFL